jgi:hypothetical protein
VIDISSIALTKAKERLKENSQRVRWIEADIRSAGLRPAEYDLWHDRAVFHFLTETEDREAYIKVATQSIKDAGFLVVATFGPGGPMRCSGLPVERYGPQELAAQFPDFCLLEARAEEHVTPSGRKQNFTYVLMQKV